MFATVRDGQLGQWEMRASRMNVAMGSCWDVGNSWGGKGWAWELLVGTPNG